MNTAQLKQKGLMARIPKTQKYFLPYLAFGDVSVIKFGLQVPHAPFFTLLCDTGADLCKLHVPFASHSMLGFASRRQEGCPLIFIHSFKYLLSGGRVLFSQQASLSLCSLILGVQHTGEQFPWFQNSLQPLWSL